jgi:hypothetical protein
MVDPNLLLRTWLLTTQLPQPDGSILTNPVLAALAATPKTAPWPITPIFAGHLPEGYDSRQTGNGIAIVVRVGGSGTTSGGVAHPEIPIIDPRMQISVWAGTNEYQLARVVDRAIFDWIHAKSAVDFGDIGHVLVSLNQVIGQDINDVSSGLATVVSYYHLTLREN